jgi:ferritin
MSLGSEKIFDAFNRQIGNEMGASLQYISIAAYFDQQGLGGLARFFYRQSDEERAHAMKFVNFVVDAGGPLRIPQVAAPRNDFSSAADAVGAALAWEREVTKQIYGLVDIGKEESNYIALRFLDWFVDEQFEEVTTMEELLQVVERAGDDNLLAVEEYLSREGMLPERAAENGPE